jgi:hypothetical protein
LNLPNKNQISFKDTLFITFLDDFNDTLIIQLDSTIISKSYFYTDESIGVCRNMLTVIYDNTNQNILIYGNKKNLLCKVNLKNAKKFLYLRKVANNFYYEFDENPLEGLE